MDQLTPPTMKLEKKMSLLCQQAAVLRYIRIHQPLVGWRVVPVPVGQRPLEKSWFVVNQN